MTSRSAADLPHVTAVCLLQAYSDAHDQGNTNLKSAMWNLNKARRQRGNGASISALDVREELRARAVLRQATPDLADEGDSGSNKESKDEDYFKLVDAVEEIAEMRSQKENDMPKTNADEGLRRRKADNVDTKKEWTEEQSPDEDDRLRSADPVDLFGAFPPRDLIVAQKDAKKTLASFIEAANLARAILEVTNNQK